MRDQARANERRAASRSDDLAHYADDAVQSVERLANRAIELGAVLDSLAAVSAGDGARSELHERRVEIHSRAWWSELTTVTESVAALYIAAHGSQVARCRDADSGLSEADCRAVEALVAVCILVLKGSSDATMRAIPDRIPTGCRP